MSRLVRHLEQYIAEYLSGLDNFAKPEDWSVFKHALGDECEHLFGIYMNTPEDFVLITWEKLHRFKGDKVRSLAYEGIREVDLPKDPAQRALYVHMKNGDTFLLPISNETNEYPDYFAFRDFLVAVVYAPHFSETPEDIEKITSRDDLITFLKAQGDSQQNSDLISSLQNGYPSTWQLDLFKIDSKLLERQDIWRLLALFLSRPLEVPFQGSQAIAPGTWVHHDIIRAIEIGKPEMQYDDEGNEIDPPPLGEVEIDSLEVPPEILNALSDEAAEIITFAIEDCNHGMLTDAGLLLALVAFDGKLASMILERKDLTVGAIRKDIGLRMGKQRTYFSNLVRSNASAIKIMEKSKELSQEKKSKQITPEIILYAIHDSNDAWINLVLSSFQRSW
jgi:hypothetical protein